MSKPYNRAHSLWPTLISGVFSVGVLVLLWEAAGRNGSAFTAIIPPPSRFISQLAEDGFRVGLGSQAATLPQSILSSIMRVVVGLILGMAAAFSFGFLLTANIWFKRLLLPVIRLLAPIAPVAWIPLGLVLFNIGNQTAVFIVFMGVFFTLTIATVRAIEVVPQNILNSARMMGTTRWQLWLRVTFPAILPSVFTIMRLNFIAAWMAVLAAEMTGLQDGLGAIIMTGRNLFNNEMILLGMVLIGVVGFVFDLVLKALQDFFFWWDTTQ